MGSDDTTTLKNDLTVVKDLGTFVACSDMGAWALHQYLAELLHTYRGGRDNLFKFKSPWLKFVPPFSPNFERPLRSI